MGKAPPNALAQAYEKLDEETKRLFMKFGLFLVVFSVAVPMTAGIWYEFSASYWLMSASAFSVGVGFIWPPLIIWAVMALPTAFAKLIPSKRLADAVLPDRRALPRGGEVWSDEERELRAQETPE